MALNCIKSLRNIAIRKKVIGVVGCRTYAAGKAKFGVKGGGSADALKKLLLTNELKSTIVVGANINKEETLKFWQSLSIQIGCGNLLRNALPYDDLKRFVKLDNRAKRKYAIWLMFSTPAKPSLGN